MRDINLIRLRYLISVVSQEPILFDCSIKDNITYGLDTPLSMEEIITVARAANIHDFITNLPKVRKSCFIRKTYPCDVYPLEPHFYIEKLGFAGVSKT